MKLYSEKFAHIVNLTHQAEANFRLSADRSLNQQNWYQVSRCKQFFFYWKMNLSERRFFSLYPQSDCFSLRVTKLPICWSTSIDRQDSSYKILSFFKTHCVVQTMLMKELVFVGVFGCPKVSEKMDFKRETVSSTSQWLRGNRACCSEKPLRQKSKMTIWLKKNGLNWA